MEIYQMTLQFFESFDQNSNMKMQLVFFIRIPVRSRFVISMSADSIYFQLNLKMTGFDTIVSLKFQKNQKGSKGGRTNVDIEARVRVPRA